ncbi:hypothetical protein BDQ12DRAFT_688005 [Crucibulum laeve]|uniref:ABM domain-containing protein n=1 Tax=Crucibulum laeve TaxID=68775 RepID=A0A5C3LS25_9AGAR|nr:hypothetical protein BDQ12DRAFT_688005 [Crucibulum laeve]
MSDTQISTSSTSGIILHNTLHIDPTKIDEYLKHLRPAWKAVCAEPECDFFEVSTNPQEPGVYRFTEGWNASLEWLITIQANKEYYKPYLAATEPLYIKPRVLEVFNRESDWSYRKPTAQ